MLTQEISALLGHVREHVHEYFTDLDSRAVVVKLLKADVRAQSRMYWLEIRASDVRRRVLVKVTAQPPVDGIDGEPPAGGRPRLGLFTDCSVKHEFEYDGLVRVHERLAALGDPRFGTVRPLDFLAGSRAIVMEVVDHPTLRQLLFRTARLTPSFARVDLTTAFRNVGAWLRTFHDLSAGDDSPVQRRRREDVAEAFDAFTSYLGERVPARHERIVRTAGAEAVRHIQTALPKVQRMGLGHGDFAPRNIFVARDSRIIVIDMLARSRVPIFEDLAYLSVSLHTTQLHLMTRGAAFDDDAIARYDRELMTGYFASEEPPRRALAIYKLLVLFDKWSSLVARSSNAVGVGRLTNAPRVTLSHLHFSEEVRRLVQVIDSG